jgi:hypothetical protein
MGRFFFLSYSFYLYRFLKYVSYGFPIKNFCNPGVHYETPCRIIDSTKHLVCAACQLWKRVEWCDSEEWPMTSQRVKSRVRSSWTKRLIVSRNSIRSFWNLLNYFSVHCITQKRKPATMLRKTSVIISRFSQNCEKRLISWGASSPLCWFNNKEFCVLHIQSNTTIFYLLIQ